ncbi:hypothetical protein [Gordonia malaquae]|uniref:hypothetical protein n=1 Tax=Gordonia malaquae TaxID=410332 RepID=UPI0030170F6C
MADTLTEHEQQLLDMLNGPDWANGPWERFPEQDHDDQIAFRGQQCDRTECHHPVHAFHPEPSRHLEWFATTKPQETDRHA